LVLELILNNNNPINQGVIMKFLSLLLVVSSVVAFEVKAYEQCTEICATEACATEVTCPKNQFKIPLKVCQS